MTKTLLRNPDDMKYTETKRFEKLASEYLENDNRLFLLPAGKIENRKELNKQLGFDEDHSWPVAFIAVACAVFVMLIVCAVLAALSFPYWSKHFGL